mmetsp:Transcript_712/g.886  ORF Transcript_712/g.886 Transcript_712/m.886 type:complete len:144 (-) Transcript_712:243-674(-)|eukprot:CAMPEP_0170507776 /NCGR_PEP_ID=MMETSP0208-20121228/60062_1 /TAXON_ID=197538 /ORGANISM="Strombidium inclinatum, Strain S3" /LENGTH=143 /DNA_ID=CAMNT_0010790217 /DNA_START=54 /DNA_END=485 /DNA_ORIENTATION=+
MFNVIQDSILLVRGDHLYFKNTLAQEFLDKVADEQEESLNELNQAVFFELNQFTENQDQIFKSNFTSYSLMSLLELPQGEVAAKIFTSSKEIAEASRMDEIQKIVEDLKDDSGSAPLAFFSIKLIKVKGEAKSSSDKEPEIMV